MNVVEREQNAQIARECFYNNIMWFVIFISAAKSAIIKCTRSFAWLSNFHFQVHYEKLFQDCFV